jgi:hypothetical protein
MAFNLGEIGAAITLDDSDFVKTLGGLEQKTIGVLKKVGGFALGLLGFKELAQYAQDSVKAFIVQDNAVNGLTRALQAIGQGGYSKKLQEVASSLQDVTTFGDEATLQVMTLGLNMGLTADKMESATKAAMGLAAKYSQLDLNTAMQLIAKAANGNTARLKMFGIQIDETKTKTEQLNELLKKGEDAFPLAKAQTFGQHLIQLQNAWGDLSEQVGEFIVTLFDLDSESRNMLDLVNEATAWMKENLDVLAYEVQYVWAEVVAGFKRAYVLVEPVLSYIFASVKDLVNNIIAITQWAIENSSRIWDNLPKIFWAHLQDIYGAWKKTFEMILDLGVNFVKALWTAIKGGGAEGFRALWDELQSDFQEVLAANFEHKMKVFQDVGMTPFPEMQKTAYLSDVVHKYENVNKEFDKINRETAKKQWGYQKDLIERLNKKRSQDPEGNKPLEEDPVKATKNNVAGSFSAAVLTAMLGSGAPEKETAKNTRKMVELQRETNAKLSKKDTYN